MFTAAAGIATNAAATEIFVIVLRTRDGVVHVIGHSLRRAPARQILPPSLSMS
jgi:hypothetical protein